MDLRDHTAVAAHWAQLVPEDETPTTDALKRLPVRYLEDVRRRPTVHEEPPKKEEPIDRGHDDEPEPRPEDRLWALVARLDATITPENAIGGRGKDGEERIAAVMGYSLKHARRLLFTLTEADFIRAVHPTLGPIVTCPRSLPPELRRTAIYYTCQNSGQWFGQTLHAQADTKRQLGPGNYLFRISGS